MDSPQSSLKQTKEGQLINITCLITISYQWMCVLNVSLDAAPQLPTSECDGLLLYLLPLTVLQVLTTLLCLWYMPMILAITVCVVFSKCLLELWLVFKNMCSMCFRA